MPRSNVKIAIPYELVSELNNEIESLINKDIPFLYKSTHISLDDVYDTRQANINEFI